MQMKVRNHKDVMYIQRSGQEPKVNDSPQRLNVNRAGFCLPGDRRFLNEARKYKVGWCSLGKGIL